MPRPTSIIIMEIELLRKRKKFNRVLRLRVSFIVVGRDYVMGAKGEGKEHPTAPYLL
jgi:hypothetical protein